jgi:hypothetical protein
MPNCSVLQTESSSSPTKATCHVGLANEYLQWHILAMRRSTALDTTIVMVAVDFVAFAT